MIPDDDD